jgi:hypothetical protein
MAHRAVDVSSLRTAISGECVDTSPSSAVRCTISILRKEVRRIVLRAHVVNDTEELVRCAPGSKRDSHALLQTELDLFCEPHAELGFLFAVPRFGRSGRSAFVRVSGTTFACGFDEPIDDDALRAAAISLGAAALLLAVVAGVVLYERRRRRAPDRARPQPEKNEAVSGELVDEAPAVVATIPEAMRGIEARGFAAVLDEQRIVMGALEATQQHALSSEFVAKVVNQTAEPVLCTLTGRTRKGIVPVPPGAFRIHPQSAAAVAVVVPLRLPWRLRTLHLNMESSALRASAQASVPVPLAVKIAITTAAAACMLAVAVFGYRAMRPDIRGFAVPSRVLAGSAATVSYQLSGVGSGRYEILFAGSRIAVGSVPAGSGTIIFATSRRAGTYLVSLRMSGPLGSTQQTLAVAAVTHLTALAPSIGELTVDPGVAAAGAPITIRYAASADNGSVALVDAGGIALERAPYSVHGVTMMRAPTVDTPTQYQVALDATRSGSTAHASVGLLVLPQALATAAPLPAAPAGMMTATQLLQLPAHVVSAHGFTVALLAHPADLSLALQGPNGSLIASESVAAGATSVRLPAPRVTKDERFYLVAHLRIGTAEQVLLDPLTIYAR